MWLTNYVLTYIAVRPIYHNCTNIAYLWAFLHFLAEFSYRLICKDQLPQLIFLAIKQCKCTKYIHNGNYISVWSQI